MTHWLPPILKVSSNYPLNQKYINSNTHSDSIASLQTTPNKVMSSWRRRFPMKILWILKLKYNPPHDKILILSFMNPQLYKTYTMELPYSEYRKTETSSCQHQQSNYLHNPFYNNRVCCEPTTRYKLFHLIKKDIHRRAYFFFYLIIQRCGNIVYCVEMGWVWVGPVVLMSLLHAYKQKKKTNR